MACLDYADAQTVLDLRYSDMTRRHCFKRNGPSLNRRIIKAGTTQGRTLQDTTPSLNQSKCDSSERDLHEAIWTVQLLSSNSDDCVRLVDVLSF